MGYELETKKAKYLIVRYYTRNRRLCPTGSTKWRQIERLKRFKNVNSVLNLGANIGVRATMIINPHYN